jgi:hypothetical protein
VILYTMKATISDIVVIFCWLYVNNAMSVNMEFRRIATDVYTSFEILKSRNCWFFLTVQVFIHSYVQIILCTWAFKRNCTSTMCVESFGFSFLYKTDFYTIWISSDDKSASRYFIDQVNDPILSDSGRLLCNCHS